MGTSLVLEVMGMVRNARQGVAVAAAAIDDGAAGDVSRKTGSPLCRPMSDFLKKMAALSRQRVATIPRTVAAKDLDLPLHALRLQDFDVIAEIKNRSPSEGPLADAGEDRRTRARNYAQGGAAAISVLTEPSAFAGDLQHLREVVEALSGLDVPVMRKDFLLDPLQILEARVAGASGVLLIAAMLSDAKLEAMLDCACEHSMFVLLESFDDTDLNRCVALLDSAKHLSQAESNKLLIGVNTRNLRTLAVRPDRLAQLGTVAACRCGVRCRERHQVCAVMRSEHGSSATEWRWWARR